MKYEGMDGLSMPKHKVDFVVMLKWIDWTVPNIFIWKIESHQKIEKYLGEKGFKTFSVTILSKLFWKLNF